MCHGKWDCWNGEEEINCRNLCCIKMYKCKLSSICIHTNNVCDKTLDCPLNDDEMICIETSCVDHCIFLNFDINCLVLIAFITGEILFSLLSNFVFINISNKLQSDNINRLHNALIFLAKNNNLLFPLFCDLSYEDIKLQLMDLSFNKIFKLDRKQMIMNHSEIEQIEDFVFKTLTKLKSLDISSNKIFSLHKCVFCGLYGLLLLNNMDNNIIYVHRCI